MNLCALLRVSVLFGFVGVLVLPIFGAELLIEQGGLSAAAGVLIVAVYGGALFLFVWTERDKGAA
jgi:hypothetical protein